MNIVTDESSTQPTSTPTLTLDRLVDSIVLLAIFLLTFLVQFPRSIVNDGYTLVTGGRQIIAYGDLPYRDFLDPGLFALYFLSALTQFIFGYNTFGEAILAGLALALSAVLTYQLATHISHSKIIAILVTLCYIASIPRAYNYYKLFSLALAIVIIWRYIDNPKGRNIIMMAIYTAIVTCIRLDLGVYIGSASVAAVLYNQWNTKTLPQWKSFGAYLIAVLLTMSPFLVFLQIHGGIFQYYATVYAFGVREKVDVPFGFPFFTLDTSQPFFDLQTNATPFDRPLGPPITILWSTDVTPELRQQLESQYQLSRPQPTGEYDGRVWTYDIKDSSDRNAQALINNPLVADTAGIDRRLGVVTSQTPESNELIHSLTNLTTTQIAILPGLFHTTNALLFWYYLAYGLPVIAVIILILRNKGATTTASFNHVETNKLVSLTLMTLLSVRLLVVEPLHVRLSDVGTPLAILGAALTSLLLQSRWPKKDRANQLEQRHGSATTSISNILSHRRFSTLQGIRNYGIATSLLLLSWLSITNATGTGIFLDRTAARLLITQPFAIIGYFQSVSEAHLESPIELINKRMPDSSTGMIGNPHHRLMHYVASCTRASDRVLTGWFTPDFSFNSNRGYAGGIPFIAGNHFSDAATQLWVLEQLKHEEVPLILLLSADGITPHFPLATVYDQYIRDSYAPIVAVPGDNIPTHWIMVFADRSRQATGTYASLPWPCYS